MFSFSRCVKIHHNTLPENTIVTTLAKDKFKNANDLQFLFDTVENIVGKEQNAGYQNILLFPQCFLKFFLFFSQGCQKSSVKVKGQIKYQRVQQ